MIRAFKMMLIWNLSITVILLSIKSLVLAPVELISTLEIIYLLYLVIGNKLVPVWT